MNVYLELQANHEQPFSCLFVRRLTTEERILLDTVRNSPVASHFRDSQTFIYSVFKANCTHFCMTLIKMKPVLNRLSLQVIPFFFILNVFAESHK